ncbi:MAG: hydrolase [Spirochaetes bacterium RIFOXYC1_FULL_54_7]|nr:MAG: hydrolase [Spirochaetes bacterium RIFOXYC1_FULL_54_7]
MQLRERIKSSLKYLTSLVGVSGYEQGVIQYILHRIAGLADDVSVDRNGNILLIKKGSTPGPSMMLTAHMDEIGFCVKNIMGNGFLAFDILGGVSEGLLPGRKVWITEKKIPGVIGVKARHIQTQEERQKIKSVRECYIDIGASSREEVASYGIRVGQPIVFQSDFMVLSNPDLVSTKAIDNRINCAILIELLNDLKNEQFPGTLNVVFSVKEEVGMLGAQMVGSIVKPDYAIALDTIPCGDTPDINTESRLPVYLGKGPVCPLVDSIVSAELYTIIHPKIREMIEQASIAASVAVQYLTIAGESYTTDASRLALAAGGIPVGVLAIPRRYSHSPVELLDIKDAEGSFKVIKELVRRNGEIDLAFL